MIRRNKYNARRVTIDGITFASKKEAARYQELKLLEAAGKITDLRAHPRYELKVNDILIGYYTPDSYYWELYCGNVVEEVKGGNATKTEAYRLRVKLFKALYPGIDHREI